MEITCKVDDRGNLSVNLYDAFNTLDDEVKQEIISGLSWDAPIMQEIVKQVQETYATENYNSKIYKLRLAFLQSEDAARGIRQVIGSLVSQIKNQQNELNAYHKSYWGWVHWWEQNHKQPHESQPVPYPHYQWQAVSNEQDKRVLEVLGMTPEVLDHPTSDSSSCST